MPSQAVAILSRVWYTLAAVTSKSNTSYVRSATRQLCALLKRILPTVRPTLIGLAVPTLAVLRLTRHLLQCLIFSSVTPYRYSQQQSTLPVDPTY